MQLITMYFFSLIGFEFQSNIPKSSASHKLRLSQGKSPVLTFPHLYLFFSTFFCVNSISLVFQLDNQVLRGMTMFICKTQQEKMALGRLRGALYRGIHYKPSIWFSSFRASLFTELCTSLAKSNSLEIAFPWWKAHTHTHTPCFDWYLFATNANVT